MENGPKYAPLKLCSVAELLEVCGKSIISFQQSQIDLRRANLVRHCPSLAADGLEWAVRGRHEKHAILMQPDLHPWNPHVISHMSSKAANKMAEELNKWMRSTSLM